MPGISLFIVYLLQEDDHCRFIDCILVVPWDKLWGVSGEES